MKEHPILFSGPMVRAILEGHKTMTRRIVRGQCEHVVAEDHDGETKICRHCEHGTGYIDPPYERGDRLWVRENFWCAEQEGYGVGVRRLFYSTDDIMPLGTKNGHDWDGPHMEWGHHPSIHMPRWASRITLEVEAVRVERAQDITSEDAVSEGIDCDDAVRAVLALKVFGGSAEISAFATLWDSLNAKRGYGWAVNPWVWVVSFKNIAGQ